MFLNMTPIPDPYTTGTHFARSQLKVVEAVVRSVVHDDFTRGGEVRRWLEDDEYLVRRRVHRDVKALFQETADESKRCGS